MTEIVLNVVGASAVAKSNGKVTSGSIGLPVNITYDESWNNLSKTAFFRVGNHTRTIKNVGTRTTVPWEVLRNHGKPLEIGVEGRNSSGNIVVPTVWASVSMVYEGANGEVPAAPNPSNPTVPSGGSYIDDSLISLETTWSSKNIVDKCLPSFSESGSVVTCEPVEGYPLEVVSQIIPKQSGSGDPSPENVRPITGRTGVKLWRTGKNLLPDGYKDWNNYVNSCYLIYLPPGRYCVWGKFDTSIERYVYLQKSTDGGRSWSAKGIGINSTDGYICGGTAIRKPVFDVTNDPNEKWCIWTRQGDLPYIEYLQIEQGSAATEYEPYRGEEFTIDFGQTVCGGSLDWKTGVLTESMARFTLTGAENWNALGTSWQDADKFGCYASVLDLPAPQFEYKPSQSELPCSHCVPGNWAWSSAKESGLLLLNNKIVYLSFSTTVLGITDGDDDAQKLEKFKAYLVGQYSADTPVEFCYTPTTEPTILAFEPQEILSLSGVNTLYSDTGDTTVTGKADPTAVIEKLTNAIIALGGNV